ncbi:Replication factor A protein 1 [Myotisia sp. PD_48]|nr:Replication factor A protein 1 [Myotisia sp. PD_48]
MANQISTGALSAMFENSNAKIEQPILQCLHIKPIAVQQTERFRVVFSDIINYVRTILPSQLNSLVTDSSLRRGSLVRLTQFRVNIVKGKHLLIILGLDVLDEFGEPEKIGNPTPLETVPTEESGGRSTSVSTSEFYGAQQQVPQQQLQPSQRPRPSGAALGNIFSIEALSPFCNKWTIKARCTHKSNIKSFKSAHGDGKLFSVNLLDDSGEIRATAFKEQCDLLYRVFEEGSVYYISSPCRVQLAKKEFTHIKNDYELMFERDTVVEKAEDQEDVPQIRFNFTNIGNLQSIEKGTTIDVLGILKDIGATSQVMSKTANKPFDKRDLTLVDGSGFSVRLTIWGNTATAFDMPLESVIAFKGAKVSDFGGRSLSLLSSGSMTADPDIEEAHRLKGWYEAQGRSTAFASYTSGSASSMSGTWPSFKTISQIGGDHSDIPENAPPFAVRATIVRLGENLCYPACPGDSCSNKKVSRSETGQWHCERCDKSYPEPKFRYILSLNAMDHTGQIWLNCFDETGQAIFGMSADQLMQLKDENEQFVNEVVKDISFRCWNFSTRYQVSLVSPVDYRVEAENLMDVIASYEA